MSNLKESRWTRDLANRDLAKYPNDFDHLTAAQVDQVMRDHMSVRATDAEMVADTTAIMTNKSMSAAQKQDALDALSRGYSTRSDAADEIDEETAAAAIKMAQVGIAALGGEACVHMAGSQRLDGDPSSGNKGSKLTTVTVMLTVITPLVEIAKK
jgi:hypothetical protein